MSLRIDCRRESRRGSSSNIKVWRDDNGAAWRLECFRDRWSVKRLWLLGWVVRVEVARDVCFRRIGVRDKVGGDNMRRVVAQDRALFMYRRRRPQARRSAVDRSRLRGRCACGIPAPREPGEPARCSSWWSRRRGSSARRVLRRRRGRAGFRLLLLEGERVKVSWRVGRNGGRGPRSSPRRRTGRSRRTRGTRGITEALRTSLLGND